MLEIAPPVFLQKPQFSILRENFATISPTTKSLGNSIKFNIYESISPRKTENMPQKSFSTPPYVTG